MKSNYAYVVLSIKDKDGNIIRKEATEIRDNSTRCIEDEAAILLRNNRNIVESDPDGAVEFEYIDLYKRSWKCKWR